MNVRTYVCMYVASSYSPILGPNNYFNQHSLLGQHRPICSANTREKVYTHEAEQANL